MSEHLYILPESTTAPILEGIAAAKRTIHLWMYEFSSLLLAHAFAAASNRGVKITLIFDHNQYHDALNAATLAILKKAQVTIIPSSNAFRFNHAKTMIIDERIAFIMSCDFFSGLNMQNRDYIFTTENGLLIQDLQNLFNADLVNAKNNGNFTPQIHSPRLVISPTNATARISSLFQNTQGSIIGSTESFDTTFLPLMSALVHKGMTTRLIIPNNLCNPSSKKAALEIAQNGVLVRILPSNFTTGIPSSPYGHGKALVSDGAHAYIGSENFTECSLTHNREIGILFDHPAHTFQILERLEKDWLIAKPLSFFGLITP